MARSILMPPNVEPEQHEARLNAVVETVRRIIPGHLLDSVVRNGKLVL